MKPGQIRPLYLEPRLHKQSVKQEINNHGTCLAKPIHTNNPKMAHNRTAKYNIELKTSSDQWKLLKGHDVDF
jgi:hypothetical protein